MDDDDLKKNDVADLDLDIEEVIRQQMQALAVVTVSYFCLLYDADRSLLNSITI